MTILTWLIVLAAVRWLGLYLFGSGFFLTRYAMTTRNVCADAANASAASFRPSASRDRAAAAHDDDDDDDEQSGRQRADKATPICWTRRRYSKAVLLVIDALRVDFLRAPSPANVDNDVDDDDNDQYYLNGFPFVKRLLTERARNSLLFEFEADAPTVTMQRIKGRAAHSRRERRELIARAQD